MLKPASIIILFTTDKKILMHHRAKRASIYNQEWGFLGGLVEEGESPEEAARREVYEEVGYLIPELSFLNAYPLAYSDGSTIDTFVYIAPFPGWKNLHPGSEGDIRAQLKLVPINETMALPSFENTAGIIYDLIKHFAANEASDQYNQ